MNRSPGRRFPATLTAAVGALLLAAFALLAPAQEERGRGIVLSVEGAIGPANVDYLVRGIEEAQREGARLVVLEMDTPGGLMASTRDLIKTILSSNVPVVTWVTPGGARAASAGTYILYASHVAAMAPATNLGSATPVQMGGMPGMPETDDAPDPNGEAQAADDSAMERKVLEDAVSYLRGLADRHGRNADWAERAVREAANLGAAEALEQGVIDLVAGSRAELLEQIDGRTVAMAGGERTLSTAGVTLEDRDPGWRTRLLSVITNPNVAYLLMLIGFYGIFFELANPGALVPGVIGATSLILALFAFQVLSVNYAGLALIFLGLAFIIGEAFVPSFGVLGIGGLVAFVAGSIILMDGTNQAVSLPTVGGIAVIGAGFLLWAVTRLVAFRRQTPVYGAEHLSAERAEALEDFVPEGSGYRGHVRMNGERWRATANEPVQSGESLSIQTLDGLTVQVTPADKPR
jgi:membrane-bound serine protease (ClpP class)